MDVIKAMENVGLPDGTTTMQVTIADCGQINFDYPIEEDEDPYWILFNWKPSNTYCGQIDFDYPIEEGFSY